MRYLVRMGINPQRLVARGEGENQPIDTNRTSAGRGRNNRAEMLILRQTIKRPGELDDTTPEEALAAQKKSGTLSVALHRGTWAHVYVNNKKIVPKAPLEGYELPTGRPAALGRKSRDWTRCDTDRRNYWWP